MAMTENLVSGKKYRILTDAANDVWDRISFWTKASDVYYNDDTTAEANKPVAILKRSTAYAVGDIAYEITAPSWVLLRCTTAGTTKSTTPSTYSTITSVGTVITDNTAKFTVYDIRPSTTLSTSKYQIPAMSLVNSLNAELTANSKKFYFDYQNGEYGFNTASNRAAATFVPFGGSEPEEGIYCNKLYTYEGYYSYAFGAQGWATSTQFIFNSSQAFNATVSNITALSVDGVSKTVSSNQYTFSNTSGYFDGNDHIFTFTVKSGSLPSFKGDTTSTKYVDKLIFNK